MPSIFVWSRLLYGEAEFDNRTLYGDSTIEPIEGDPIFKS